MFGKILDWLSNDSSGRFVFVGIALVIVFITVRVLQTIASKRIQDRETRYRVRKLVAGAGYFAFLVSCLTIFGTMFSDIAIVAGFASAGIAFALQEVIASIAGYFANLFGGFFKIGDRVQLGGIRGDVIDISVLRTTLMELGEWVDGDLYNGRIVRVANSFLFKSPVFNYSGDFPFVWDEIKIPVRFGSDQPLAKTLLQEAAEQVSIEFVESSKVSWKSLQSKYRIEDARLTAMVTRTINDNWVEYTIRYLVAFDRRRMIKDRLFTTILESIEGTNGNVQFASKTLEISGKI